jgi:crossover junction endodeoxyribonuclease RusA
MITFYLGWPDKNLSQNARVHHFARARATKTARQSAWVIAHVAMTAAHIRKGALSAPNVHLTFHPPDKRRRDLHNLEGSMKAAIDGIQDALGVDDSTFHITRSWGDIFLGGKVSVRITKAWVDVPLVGVIS